MRGLSSILSFFATSLINKRVEEKRESYMIHLLFLKDNLLRKRNKMRGLPRILSLFRNEFDKLTS